jgi:hypothetical protein
LAEPYGSDDKSCDDENGGNDKNTSNDNSNRIRHQLTTPPLFSALISHVLISTHEQAKWLLVVTISVVYISVVYPGGNPFVDTFVCTLVEYGQLPIFKMHLSSTCCLLTFFGFCAALTEFSSF